MRITMLARLIALVMSVPLASSAMETAPESLGTGMTVAEEPKGADGESTVPASGARRSGGRALAVGLGATLLPVGLGLILDPAQADGQGGEIGVTLGAMVGLLFGPAVGLASGGRGDLAWRGVAIRGVGGALLVLGGAAALGTIDEASPGATAIMWLGIAGGGLAVASSIYDLVRTPKAVEEGRRVSFRPLVTPNGMVGVRATF
ncbi:MAG TPA: hypothetical protein VJN62_16575 [Gemmatimonadales bacterium]|nr:hypothetical protein [Gemmatimonadales bacterium]